LWNAWRGAAAHQERPRADLYAGRTAGDVSWLGQHRAGAVYWSFGGYAVAARVSTRWDYCDDVWSGADGVRADVRSDSCCVHVAVCGVGRVCEFGAGDADGHESGAYGRCDGALDAGGQYRRDGRADSGDDCVWDGLWLARAVSGVCGRG